VQPYLWSCHLHHNLMARTLRHSSPCSHFRSSSRGGGCVARQQGGISAFLRTAVEFGGWTSTSSALSGYGGTETSWVSSVYKMHLSLAALSWAHITFGLSLLVVLQFSVSSSSSPATPNYDDREMEDGDNEIINAFRDGVTDLKTVE
jgi:hypothetical protein